MNKGHTNEYKSLNIDMVLVIKIVSKRSLIVKLEFDI